MKCTRRDLHRTDTEESQRQPLLQYARAHNLGVIRVFDGQTPKKAQREWEAVVQASHRTDFTVVLINEIGDLPGGLFGQLRDLLKPTLLTE